MSIKATQNTRCSLAEMGGVTTDDYENVLIPEFEKTVRSKGKVKLLLIFGDDFTGYSVGAAWDDAEFGFLHLKEMAGLATLQVS
jgi:hypothetical protein